MIAAAGVTLGTHVTHSYGILHVSETENLRFSLAFAFVLVSKSRDLLHYVILKGLLFSDELPSKTAQLVQEVNRYHIIE